jgi:peptidoglycan/xylan/chitin deacetylase (PgdA/CDA1 family)
MLRNNKLSLYFALGSLPLVHRLMQPYRGDAAILMYHRIIPKKQRDSLNNPSVINIVSDAVFEQQIDYIRSAYHPCSLDELQALALDDYPEEKTKGRLPVVVTFDDGYKDNLDIALPILEKHQVPATIYVSTAGLVGHSHMWWYEIWDILTAKDNLTLNWDGRQLSWNTTTEQAQIVCYLEISDILLGLPLNEQHRCVEMLRGEMQPRNYDDICLTRDEVVELDRHPLITIGAHTHNHPNLRALSYGKASEEMLRSKQILENLLGHSVDHFAYPHGDLRSADAREFSLSEKCGFRTAVTTRTGKLQDGNWFALPRTSMREEHTTRCIRAKLSGWNTFWKRDL